MTTEVLEILFLKKWKIILQTVFGETYSNCPRTNCCAVMTSPWPSLIHRPRNIQVSEGLEPSKQVKINYAKKHTVLMVYSWSRQDQLLAEDYI
jgi:hypothetical protein